MKPYTYPARPINGGPFPVALDAGLYLDDVDYYIQPKYNGWRTLVHVPTGTMFNRHCQPLSIADQFEDALRCLRLYPLPWLDCEALDRRHDKAKGSLVVLDWVIEQLIYVERREIIVGMMNDVLTLDVGEENLLAEKPNTKVWLAPSYEMEPSNEPGGEADVWAAVQEANKYLGCTFYEGVVVKRGDSTYPIQSRSPDEEDSSWVKHRFTTK